MRNAWGSSDDTPTADSEMVVRIKTSDLIPSSHSTKLAKQIRNNILRDEFDYNDAEIAEFNIKYPNDIVIGIEGHPVKWADDFQVKGWKARKDGLVPITLTEIWIKVVWNFRNQKILTATNQAAGAITNVETQRTFVDDLTKILKLSGKPRLDALMNLMTNVSGAPSTKKRNVGSIILSGGAELRGQSDAPNCPRQSVIIRR